MDGFELPAHWGCMTSYQPIFSRDGERSRFTPSTTPRKESFMVRRENSFFRLFFSFLLDGIRRNFPTECFCFSVCTKKHKPKRTGSQDFLWED